MGEEVDANEGVYDVGHHEPLREVLAQSQVEAEGQPSIGGDGSAIILTQVVVDTFLASWNKFEEAHRGPNPCLTGTAVY
jgi:hypothetical protein